MNNQIEIAMDKRIEELEELADQFWPGKEKGAAQLRAWYVWRQLSEEISWDLVKEMEPDRDVEIFSEEAFEELCTCGLQPSYDCFGAGFGDGLRMELKRQGRSLDDLFDAQKLMKENIPWEEMPPIPQARDPLERKIIRQEIRKKQYPWNG